PRPPVAPSGGYGFGGAISPATGLPLAPSASSFSTRLNRILARDQGGGVPPPLVIRSSEMGAKDQAHLEEDLAIMSRILLKAAGEAPGARRTYTAMGIDVANAAGSSQMRSLYLEGYGALFTLEVDFPLMAAPTANQPQGEGSKTNSDWEQAKQEMYGQTPNGIIDPRIRGPIDPTTGLPAMGAWANPAPVYDEQRVNRLRDNLLSSFRDAVNIRGLKPDEWVTITVFNLADSGAGIGLRPPIWPRSLPAGEANGLTGSGAVMNLRAKLSSIDELAKGKVTLDDFRHQVQVEIYPVAPSTGGTAAASGGEAGSW
ncbi:MAG: hypothetical protein ACREIC_18340, partial [Limisphaerales bacterium]